MDTKELNHHIAQLSVMDNPPVKFVNEQGFVYPPKEQKDKEYFEKCWNACRGNFKTIEDTYGYIVKVFYGSKPIAA